MIVYLDDGQPQAGPLIFTLAAFESQLPAQSELLAGWSDGDARSRRADLTEGFEPECCGWAVIAASRTAEPVNPDNKYPVITMVRIVDKYADTIGRGIIARLQWEPQKPYSNPMMAAQTPAGVHQRFRTLARANDDVARNVYSRPELAVSAAVCDGERRGSPDGFSRQTQIRNGKGDGPDTTRVRPTGWNAEHDFKTSTDAVVLGRAAGSWGGVTYRNFPCSSMFLPGTGSRLRREYGTCRMVDVCRSTFVARATFPQLFAAIGTVFGAGDGTTGEFAPYLIFAGV